MNLVEIWIGDIVNTEDVIINGDKKIKFTFNTICWGARGTSDRVFNSMEEWESFKSKKFYLG